MFATHNIAAALVAFAVIAAGHPSTAEAQWTLPQGQVFVSTGFDFQFANSEFFGEDGFRSERQFPLNGEYFGAAMNISARAGLTDEFEIELYVPLRIASYTSDPVLLLPQPMGSMEPSIDYYQRNVIELSQATAGLADVQVAARYRFLPPPFVLTGEIRLKVPGGYDGPEGTFGAEPTSAMGLIDDIVNVVRPENTSDDVTLGDGQVDLTGRLLAGVSFDTGTFIAADGAYNVRFGEAGHQVLASLRAGQLIENVVLLFAGASFGISVTEGRVIGVSVAAMDPELPAVEYGGTNNLVLREVRLQRDYLDVYGGIIVRLSPELELKAAYGRTVWGRNTAAVNTFSIGFGGRTTLFDVPDSGGGDEEYEDEEYEDEEESAPAEDAPR